MNRVILMLMSILTMAEGRRLKTRFTVFPKGAYQ
jgi:hypothetical protein